MAQPSRKDRDQIWPTADPIKKLLATPADHDVVMLLPIGYPLSDEQFSAATERLSLDQIVSYDRFSKS